MHLIDDNPIAEALALLGYPTPPNMSLEKMALMYLDLDGDPLIPTPLRKRALMAICSQKCGPLRPEIIMDAEEAWGKAFRQPSETNDERPLST